MKQVACQAGSTLVCCSVIGLQFSSSFERLMPAGAGAAGGVGESGY